jgi:amino acid permease
MSGTVAQGWKAFFWLAASYNFVIGLGSFLTARWGSPAAISAVLVACFGIVYALVGQDPLRYAPMLVAGIVGKVMVVLMVGVPNWQPGGDPALGAIVGGDLLFTIGFCVFLWRFARRA